MDAELRRAVRTLALASRGLERVAAPLTLPQYRVLGFIVAAPERASRLAAQVDVTKATLTGVIDALESHGWIVREVVAGDRRGVSLAVTDEGIKALKTADARMAEWLTGLLGPDDDGHELVAAICRLGDAMAAHRDRVAGVAT
jgi:DNA-binding MarR family transcriptional regulator